MEKIIEARSEQEAIDQVVREFGVSEEHIEFEVLEKTKSGFLGLGGKVKVRARVYGLPQDLSKETEKEIEQAPVQARRKSHSHSSSNETHQSTKEALLLTDEQASKAIEITQKLVEYILNVTPTVTLGKDLVGSSILEITLDNPDDQNLLIGKFGKNLNALQVVMNAMLHKDMKELSENIYIDIHGYRRRNLERLEEKVKDKSEEVLRTGRPYLLEEHDPYKRFFIHNIVRTIDGVSTVSEGRGYNKKVRIFLEEE